MNSCLLCANWKPKGSPEMAKQGYAACALGARYSYMALNHSCPQFVTVPPDMAEARTQWAIKAGFKT